MMALILSSVNGSALHVSQWWNTICGKAWPAVFWRRKPVKPKDSATGRYAFTLYMGVPGRLVSSTTVPRLRLSDEYTPPIAPSGLNLNEEDGLLQAGRRSQDGREEDAA